jgi:hypothetical protein
MWRVERRRKTNHESFDLVGVGKRGAVLAPAVVDTAET